MDARTILVVDDHESTRQMLRCTLEEAGISVLEARDGEEALIVMRDSSPPVVLQDLALPDIDGFELVSLLRAVDLDRNPRILAFSGLISNVEDGRVFAAGFDDVIQKPCDPQTLVSIIDSYLPRAAREDACFGESRRLLVVDDDVVQLGITSYKLSRLGFSVIEARDGLEALELARADPPDLIVSDVMMPNLDGFGLALALRREPAFASLPLLLLSASYVDPSDRELARRAGAEDLVLRTPDLGLLVHALRVLATSSDLRSRAEPRASTGGLRKADDIVEDVERDHARRVARQLERQVTNNGRLMRRCSLLSTELTVLTRMSEAVLKQQRLAANESTLMESELDGALASCFDPSGASAGALYLLDVDGALRARPLGAGGSFAQKDVADFFGHEPWLRELVAHGKTHTLLQADSASPMCREVLDRAGAQSALVIPLVHLGTPLGALFMVSRERDVGVDFLQWRVFAQGVSNQITLSLAMGRAFRELACAQQEAIAQRRIAAERAAVWQALVENAPDVIMNLDLEGRVRFVNRPLGGVEVAALVGSSWVERASPEQREARAMALAAVLATGAATTLETSWSTNDGRSFWVESHLGPIRAGEHITGVAIIERDVTEKKQTEVQLIVSERMASVGTLAAGVAHEINNPLASVMANLDLALRDAQVLGRRSSGASELLDELRDAREGAERVRLIVRDLKVFSRVDEDQRGPVDVEHVLESTLRMAWNEIRHRARLVKDYATPPPVEANESRLGQVFLNLIVNAAQSIPEGDVRGNEIRVRTGVDDKGRVFVSVADTGGGIPTELRARLFTPFFTTKPAGVGTGLGLSICHRIVSSIGGQITVESEVGRGSEFRITLPVANTESQPPQAARKRETPSTRRGHLLVVDDEPLITQVVRRTLGRDHDVEMLNSAEDALARIRGGERYDVILCDLMMPQMTGMDFHAELTQHFPEQAAKVVFLSGGAFTARARSFLETVRNHRVEKPIDTAGLRALVHDMVR